MAENSALAPVVDSRFRGKDGTEVDSFGTWLKRNFFAMRPCLAIDHERAERIVRADDEPRDPWEWKKSPVYNVPLFSAAALAA